MRIGIEAQRLLRNKIHGVEVVAFELIMHLQKIDQVNEYFILVRDHGNKSFLQLQPNFHLIKFKGNSFLDWEQRKLPHVVKKLKLDILHCTANTAPIYCSVPIILTLHDVIFMHGLRYNRNLYQFFGNIYRRIIVPIATRSAKMIVTVSNSEKQQINAKIRNLSKKLKVIYNGVNTAFHKIDNARINSFRELYALPKNFILHFGNTAPKKNSKNAIGGYLKYCNNNTQPEPLIIAGGHDEYFKKLLFKMDIPNQVRKNIILLPYVRFEDQPLLYNSASVLLYPSTDESFGLPLLEAMACGIPVITSNTTALPEVAGSAAIYVSPFSITEIAEAIDAILFNNELYKNKVRKGLERVKLFSWEECAKKYIDLYNYVFNNKIC